MSDSLQPQFAEVLTLIKTAQQKVIATANQELIKLYWSIGKYISDRLATSEWCKKAIEQLAATPLARLFDSNWELFRNTMPSLQ